MPLSDQQVLECRERYVREHDRYAKLSEVVYEKCLELIHNMTVRATVQRRAKSPDRFAEKLRKNLSKYSSVNEVFEKISDLSGVRIATYLESDRERVVAELKKEFCGLGGGEFEVDVKNKTEGGRHYRATHCQVYLLAEDLQGTNENLKGTTCEIQVCSLLAHVFNEIEHDLDYKPLSGQLSQAESEFIDQLGLLTKAGDITIKRLLQETESRLAKRKGEFSDVFDFVARMRTEMALGEKFSENAGQLFDELVGFGLTTPERIIQQVTNGASSESLSEIANKEFNSFKRWWITSHAEQNCLLADDSSDILLAGILRTMTDKILERHPMGRGRGAPSRLVRIANAYRRMSSNNAIDVS